MSLRLKARMKAIGWRPCGWLRGPRLRDVGRVVIARSHRLAVSHWSARCEFCDGQGYQLGWIREWRWPADVRGCPPGAVFVGWFWFCIKCGVTEDVHKLKDEDREALARLLGPWVAKPPSNIVDLVAAVERAGPDHCEALRRAAVDEAIAQHVVAIQELRTTLAGPLPASPYRTQGPGIPGIDEALVDGSASVLCCGRNHDGE